MEQLTGTLSGAPNSNDYEKMNNKPQINGVELVGNKTSEELGLGGGYVTRQELEDSLKGKVDAEEGKGLSSNDFSSDEKTKLEGIEAGAQKNVPVPVKVGELENDSGYQTEEQVDEKLETVGIRLAALESLSDEHTGKINDLQEQVTGIRTMAEGQAVKLQNLEKRMDGLVDGNEVEF